jgi:TrmH family RNA methyltransferase
MAAGLVTLVRNLQRRQARRRQDLAVAEGIRVVEEAIAADVEFRGVIVSPSLERTPRGSALRAQLEDHAIPLVELPDAELTDLADTDTPQGVIAVVRPPKWTLADIQPRSRAPALVLDGVQDPGNGGALLRTAAALGASGAILLPGTVPVVHPKVLRATAGATFRFPTARVQYDEFKAWVNREGIAVWITAAEGTSPVRMQIPERLAIVVGNEGVGVRPEIQATGAQRVGVPLARGVESLNVAVAAGIILYEVIRDR